MRGEQATEIHDVQLATETLWFNILLGTILYLYYL